MKKNERKREISGRLDKLLKFLKDNNIMQFCKEEENIYIGKHTYLYTYLYIYIYTYIWKRRRMDMFRKIEGSNSSFSNLSCKC